MKKIFLFFYLFIVLNASVVKQKITKEKIKEISKKIEIISKNLDCDEGTFEKYLKIFGLNESKTNKLNSHLINACKYNFNNEDKGLLIRVITEFFESEFGVDKLRSIPTRDYPENGLATYLCEKFMILIGYEASDCYKD